MNTHSVNATGRTNEEIEARAELKRIVNLPGFEPHPFSGLTDHELDTTRRRSYRRDCLCLVRVLSVS
jgi:hypothetical protein